MTHTQYLEREKAFAHTHSIRRGAGNIEIAVFLIASGRLLQAYGDYYHAQACLESAADMIAEGNNHV